MRKRLAITMGEPGGIGPEVVLKAIGSSPVRECSMPVVVGQGAVLEEAIRVLSLPLKLRQVKSPGEAIGEPETVEFIDVGEATGFIKGMPTRAGGLASYSSIKKAVELALKAEVSGIVTAPISKEAIKLAGQAWPGHTEMLAEMAGTKDYAMMLMGKGLRVLLVTIHTALRNVPDLITKERVIKTIFLAMKACHMLDIAQPRIAVAGLNPHAGEAGLFGEEEINVIGPAIREASASGIPVSGPYPPDTVFRRALEGEFDMVISMYHDQGLIPLKLIAFHEGVNATVGLPFIRTSPDHGTAYDIAWKGVANPSAMVEAIKLATRLRHG